MRADRPGQRGLRPGGEDADALLDRYHTLTEWSTAVAAAGAEVSVVQRFHTAATIERDGIRYEFVTDKQPPWLSTKGAPPPFIDAIVKESPDVIHVNGLIFPQLVAAIRGKAGAQRAASSRNITAANSRFADPASSACGSASDGRRGLAAADRAFVHGRGTGGALARRRRARPISA